MKKQHLYFVILALTALLTLFAACGEGSAVSLDRGEMMFINEKIIEVEESVRACFDKEDSEACVEILKPSRSSSSEEDQQNQSSPSGGDEPSSQSGGDTTPSSSSLNSSATVSSSSQSGGSSSSAGLSSSRASSSSTAVSSSSRVSSSSTALSSSRASSSSRAASSSSATVSSSSKANSSSSTTSSGGTPTCATLGQFTGTAITLVQKDDGDPEVKDLSIGVVYEITYSTKADWVSSPNNGLKCASDAGAEICDGTGVWKWIDQYWGLSKPGGVLIIDILQPIHNYKKMPATETTITNRKPTKILITGEAAKCGFGWLP